MSPESQDITPLGVLNVIKSACMAAFGVQRDSVRHRDFKQGRPRDFIIAGVILTVVFVAVLIGAVKIILRLAGAG